MEVSESACLGAAYRAEHAYRRLTEGPMSFAEAIGEPPTLNLAATPNAAAAAVYDSMLERYQRLEESAANAFTVASD